MLVPDSWTITEKLSLAVAVSFHGIMKWDRAIQSLKIIYGHDYHMFSGNLCDVLYESWIDKLNVEEHVTTDPDQVLDPSYLILKDLAIGHDVLTILQLEQDLWDEIYNLSFELPINEVRNDCNDSKITKVTLKRKKMFLLVHKELEEHKHANIFTNRCRQIQNLNLNEIKRRIKANQYRWIDELSTDVDIMCTQLLNYYEYAKGGKGNQYLHIINEYKHFANNLIKDRLAYYCDLS